MLRDPVVDNQHPPRLQAVDSEEVGEKPLGLPPLDKAIIVGWKYPGQLCQDTRKVDVLPAILILRFKGMVL